MLRIVPVILMACLAAPVFAIGDRQPPASWQAELSIQAGELPVETFAAIDPQQLRQRDADPAKMGEPLRNGRLRRNMSEYLGPVPAKVTRHSVGGSIRTVVVGEPKAP